MNLFELFVKIDADTSQAEKGMKRTHEVSETLTNKIKVLSAQFEAAQKNVDKLAKEFNESVNKAGATDKATQELAKKLADAEKEAGKFAKELDAVQKEAEQSEKALDGCNEEIEDTGKKAEKSENSLANFAGKLGKGLATAAKIGVAAFGAASTAIVALGKIGLEYNSQMEQYTTNFTTMLGSQEAAAKKVEELKKFAASTPLSMDDLAKGTQTLLAFGVKSENSTKILRQLGDIALGDADKMQRLSTAFGKATAAGKVTGDTVQQMIDAGWNPLIQISKAAGETMEETQKRMSQGAISVEELQAAMESVTSGTGQFAGGMEAASHTTQGLISTLKDNAKALVGDVFMPISEGLLGEVLPSAIEAVSSLTTAFEENGISGMIEAAGEIVGKLLTGIAENAPRLIESGADLLISIIDGLVSEDNTEGLAEAALNIVETLSEKLIELAGVLGEAAFELVDALGNELSEKIPGLSVVFENLETVVISLTAAFVAYKAATAISEIIDTLRKATEGQTIAQTLLNAVMNANPFVLVTTLIVGLVAAIVTLWNTNEGFRNAVISAWKAIKSAAETIFTAIANFFTETIPNAFQSMIDWISNGISSFVDIGYQIVDSIMSGISAAWDGLVSWFNGIWNSLFGSRNVDVNVNANATSSGVNGSHAGGLNYVPFDGYIAKLHKGERVLTADEARGYTNRSNNSGYDERPIKIVVQSVLDGKVIGETAYNYNRRKARAGGT